MPGFEALDVPPVIRDALEKMGYVEPTPAQEQGIPPMLEGRDVLLEAQTGSGKTAAFGVPAVVVGSRSQGLRVLVLVPTRELARQVAEELRAIGAGSPFRAVAVTGGVHAEKEERTIAGDVRCIVATPGRLLALLEEKRLKLDRLDLVILDEADRMLDMGFRGDIETVLAAASARKQTALVSATLPHAVTQLAARHLREPVQVKATPRSLPASLQHFRLNVFEENKTKALLAVLGREKPQRCIVFVRTRTRAASIAKVLKDAGFQADALQGEMTHEQRRHVFDLFSRGVSNILVATDIASRGLDVPEMELVVNLDLPDEPGAYTHRSGRAARFGREGRVLTFVLPSQKTERLALERESGGEWTPYKLDPAEIERTEIPSGKPKPTAKPAKKPPPRAPARPPVRAPPARPPPRAPPAREEKPRVPRQRDAPADVPASRKGRRRS